MNGLARRYIALPHREQATIERALQVLSQDELSLPGWKRWPLFLRRVGEAGKRDELRAQVEAAEAGALGGEAC